MAAEDGPPQLGNDVSESLPQETPADDEPSTNPIADPSMDTEQPHDNGHDEGNNEEKPGEEEDEEDEEGEEEESDEEEDEEPRLKYATLTRNLTSLYHNGDRTSACLVVGDKMIVGTDNGNIHVFALPSLHTLRVYRAHQTSVSSISISPILPSLAIGKVDAAQRLSLTPVEESSKSSRASPKTQKNPRHPPVPRTPSNDIYIATSSIDGHVCIASLVDADDVQARNFGRPIQAVALSPEYKSDRSYISGGQAEKLILTVGGQKGRSVNASTTSAAAAASSWFGSIGLGANTGTDKILHGDEGIITNIKWSPSGKYLVWTNERGIKFMRSNLHLSASESHLEWIRISHTNRPKSDEAMGWKTRIEWIDRNNLETDGESSAETTATNGATVKLAQPGSKNGNEEVIVGWGDEVWLFEIQLPEAESPVSKGAAGTVVNTRHLKLGDCVISGVSLYTQNIVLVLAYMQRDVEQSNNGTRRGRTQRHSGLKPELRLINISTKEELEADQLPVSRYEMLSSSEYHLAILPPIKVPAQLAQRGYLGAIGSGVTAVGSGIVSGVETVSQGVWDATMYAPRRLAAQRLFSSSGDSIRSSKAGQESAGIKEKNYLAGWIPGLGSSLISKDDEQLKSVAVSQGMKIFVYSPFDVIVAVKRNLSDRLQWLVETEKYQQAWVLLCDHPETAGTSSETPEAASPPSPSKASSFTRSGSIQSHQSALLLQQNTLAEFFADSGSVTSSQLQSKHKSSAAEKEKRRVGELWLAQLVAGKNWSEAGEVAEKVLTTTTRWEHWVWKFLSDSKYDEIAFHMPTFQITPPLPSQLYEMVLGHYVSRDPRKFKDLLDQWPSDLFDISSITNAIKNQIRGHNMRKDSAEWAILHECLAKLYLADGHYKEALKCYVMLQDADTAMSLVKEHHLIEAIADDIPDFVLLRIPRPAIKTSSREELEELSSDPIKVLVDEATRGTVDVDDVVLQLNSAHLRIFLFFYLRSLWHGPDVQQASVHSKSRKTTTSFATDEGKALVDTHADIAVDLFAQYDRELLMEYLHQSTSYTYEKALKICEQHNYLEEQVYLLSKTGAMKKALFLIIDKLQDVSKAIAFAKAQDDQGLWDDFLEYSMSRPKFIAGLLAEVGTAVDPMELVKRIPSGLEIEGLRDGLKKMLREYDIQDSISAGAARVLSSEVAVGMSILRSGRNQGIKFDISKTKSAKAKDSVGTTDKTADTDEGIIPKVSPGHCAACKRAFTARETCTLIGFACGHVFHVPHLLHGPDEAENEHELPPTASNRAVDEEDDGLASGFTRAIGPKVTNARLLKDKVDAIGGCRICKAEKDKISDT